MDSIADGSTHGNRYKKGEEALDCIAWNAHHPYHKTSFCHFSTINDDKEKHGLQVRASRRNKEWHGLQISGSNTSAH
ncbi:MAG TPA: hypothetical protein VHO72_11535 [Bacteroidales bacterium]|nr:hypothetical protein [Bacteroidales bacterium]